MGHFKARLGLGKVVSGLWLTTALITVAPAGPGAASPVKSYESRKVGLAEQKCDALARQALPGVNLLSATIVGKSESSPEYCRVLGYVRPAINFELRLPTTSWNHKFLMAGCGGFCGGLLTDSPTYIEAVRRGYAAVVTDTGHWGVHPLDGRWAYKNPVAKTDFAWRGVSETTRVAKALARLFYDAEIAYSYFNGCSNGGRQGLMEAARFPDDYDGVIAGAPAQDVLGLTNLFTWVLQADRGPGGESILTAPKVRLLSEAVARECGDATGLISEPEQCGFRPSALLCKSGDGPNCLTATEVRVVEKLYATPKRRDGTTLFPSGIPLGSERFWTMRPDMPMLSPLKLASTGLLSFMIMDPEPGETYDPATFDFERDLPKLQRHSAAMTPSPDLRKFAARKGKLILWQGAADPMVPPATTINYYHEVKAALGAATDDSARLFTVPGLAHCANPPGSVGAGFDATDFDPLTALENWVEKGIAPASIPAVRRNSSGAAALASQLCPYPARAVYRGRGGRSDPASWSCSVGDGARKSLR